jgi:maltokinase
MSVVEPGRSAALAHQHAPNLVPAGAAERPITVDQTNESVIVGEAVVVKWLRPPVPVPHPGVRILRHLTAVGYEEMPKFFGAHEVDGRVEAMITEYVVDAVDGWTWYVDDLTAALESGSLVSVIETAAELGALAARLHDALATPSAEIPEPKGRATLAAEIERGRDLLAEALASTAGGAGERLRLRADRIENALRVAPIEASGIAQPIHGDLHVGQVLRTDRTGPDAPAHLALNDFDGNPVMDPADRHALRSPLVDLASLLQSIDHVGRVVNNRHRHTEADVAVFIDEAIRAALAAYELTRPLSDIDREVLSALRVVQELHELVYSARSLPRWLYVPDAALTAMFP